MSSIACVWTDFDDDSKTSQWYEDAHIPAIVGKLGTMAKNAEKAEDNMFKEIAGIHGTFMTVYDLPDGKSTVGLEAQIRPAADKLPEAARVNSRIYTEFASWLGKDWRGDERDIQMWIIVRWQPVESVHDQFVEWFTEEFAPGMLESPELLRTRIFKVDNTSSFKNQVYQEKDSKSVFQYMTFWEFDCDDLPWEILVYLGSSERWRHYVEGGYLNWQIAQYLVNRAYPDDDDIDSISSNRASITVNKQGPGGSDASDSDSTSARGSDDDNEEDEYHNADKRGADGHTHGEPYTIR
ncbi:hypothetical protein T440DRAFT_403437 [Plenodomus tracheiphilus IPT5]|uniref:EthD domain-containing protein n=1 Tax=Plenodomus tracheiphilus IPT5 TaxID=1408161 RepID=A0A6A7AZ92_9PLEO|nr:hypothetical protein T440DRAFT_403437 [Plenodomus tracheiphilus IPT5]